MNALRQFRGDLNRAWEHLAQGWQELRSRAAQALTHFRTTGNRGELETADEHFMRNASRWGFLAAELSETGCQIELRLEVPGMEPDDFEIQVVDDRLIVRGEKQVERERSSGEYHLMECAYGRFERAFPLPAAVEEGGAKARYRKGVLRITLPKSAGAATRRIPVDSG